MKIWDDMLVELAEVKSTFEKQMALIQEVRSLIDQAKSMLITEGDMNAVIESVRELTAQITEAQG